MVIIAMSLCESGKVCSKNLLQRCVLSHQMAQGVDAVLSQNALGGLVVLYAEYHAGLTVERVMKA